MQKRKLQDIEVSPIGIGCMGFSHGYGEIPSENYSIEAIQMAYDYGCSFFDTADRYAPNLNPEFKGHNELILGKAIKNYRKNVVIATKTHIPLNESEEAKKNLYSYFGKRLEDSLKRLQSDYVDLYYLHRVNLNVDLELVANAMAKLIKDGKILGWGLSQVSKEQIEKANNYCPLSAVQNIYSMLERGVEKEVIPYCKANNIAFVPFSPIASGFLSGKITQNSNFPHSDDVRKFVPQLQKENMEANKKVLDLLENFAQNKNATKAQISLAWMLHKYKNVVPIPGSKNKERIIENLGAWNIKLSEDEFLDLDKALNVLKIAGNRGFVEYEGMKMKDWGKNP